MKTEHAAAPGPTDDTRGDDLVDRAAGLHPADTVHALRRERGKVLAATQGSYDALFDPELADITVAERLLVAQYACDLTPAAELASHFAERLAREDAGRQIGEPTIAIVRTGSLESIADARLRAMLGFARSLIEQPAAGDRALLRTLRPAGIATPAIVALAQLVAYLSYLARLVVGLRAMQASGTSCATAAAADVASSTPRVTRPAPRHAAPGRPGGEGFTMQSLGWKSWLDVVSLDAATPEQLAVLEESHPQAKVSEYYRVLVHQPRILRERSAAFNAIMYASGGMPRAERELAATATSRVNGCVYCASVHAQRFAQLVHRDDVILQVFDDPYRAGTTPREQAIVRFSVALTSAPASFGPDDVASMRNAGLDPIEILDLIHSVAIFAWANRLMLNLGEPVRQPCGA